MYNEIGQRLRAFRLGSGLSADEIAKKIGISRTALYRFEKGEVVKIETLVSLAKLLGVSLPTLLGVEIEYISSSVTYFERLRQLEEKADRIIVLSWPFSFLISAPEYCESLDEILRESVSADARDRERKLEDVDRIMEILRQRKKVYELRRPAIINLISALGVERLLRSGSVGRPFLSDEAIRARRMRARSDIEYLAELLEAEPIGVQIGLVTGTLPHTGFQIFRNGERKTVAISPFRVGEHPNVSLGIGMITASEEAVMLHERLVDEVWPSALKGREAARYLRDQIELAGEE